MSFVFLEDFVSYFKFVKLPSCLLVLALLNFVAALLVYIAVILHLCCNSTFYLSVVVVVVDCIAVLCISSPLFWYLLCVYFCKQFLFPRKSYAFKLRLFSGLQLLPTVMQHDSFKCCSSASASL